MVYSDWLHDGVDHPEQLVLAVHGITRVRQDFDVMASRLGRRAWVVCPDMAGHGSSDWLAEADNYQLPTLVGDMRVLLGSLLEQAEKRGRPVQRISCIGTSLGGLVGIGVASLPQQPLPVSRLVLNDVGPHIEWQAIKRIGGDITQVQHHFADIAEGVAYLRDTGKGYGPHTDEEWLMLGRPMFRPHPDGGVVLKYDPSLGISFSSLTGNNIQNIETTLWQLYNGLKAQILLLRGAESDLLSPETAAAMASRGPRAKVVEFAGVGHTPTLVHDEQIRAVEDFLCE